MINGLTEINILYKRVSRKVRRVKANYIITHKRAAISQILLARA